MLKTLQKLKNALQNTSIPMHFTINLALFNQKTVSFAHDTLQSPNRLIYRILRRATHCTLHIALQNVTFREKTLTKCKATVSGHANIAYCL